MPASRTSKPNIGHPKPGPKPVGYIEQLDQHFLRYCYAQWLAGLWFAAGEAYFSKSRLREEMNRLNVSWATFCRNSDLVKPSPFNSYCNSNALAWASKLEPHKSELANTINLPNLLKLFPDIPYRTYVLRLEHCVGGLFFAYYEFIAKCAEETNCSDIALKPLIESIDIDWWAYQSEAKRGRKKTFSNSRLAWGVKNNGGKLPSDFRWAELSDPAA